MFKVIDLMFIEKVQNLWEVFKGVSVVNCYFGLIKFKVMRFGVGFVIKYYVGDVEYCI